ncbi:MAG: efflux transporter outer membrane subunit [Opitutales bacterium]
MLVVLLGTGCTTVPPAAEPPVSLPGGFSESGEASVPAAWWTVFKQDGLDRIIRMALAQNLDLQAARERLRAAQARARAVGADRLPALDGDAALQWSSDAPDELQVNRWSASLSVAYSVDFWGGIEAAIEAERLRAEVARSEREAAGLLLADAVARVWFQRLEARQRLDLLNEQLAVNGRILDLLRVRFRGGQVAAVDVLRQEQLIQATREARAGVAEIAELRDLKLDVLLGRNPQLPANGSVGAGTHPLPDLPPLPQTGLPAALVDRRPDIQAARFRIAVRNRETAKALSDRFPRLDLTASFGSDGSSADELFRSWIQEAGGGLLVPLFDWGARKERVVAARAGEEEALLAFGQAVLEAFREVEAALMGERRQREQLAAVEAQIKLADQTYEQLRNRYANGQIGYLDVLTALTDVQQLRREALVVRRHLLETRIDLYTAIAGPLPERLDPVAADTATQPNPSYDD